MLKKKTKPTDASRRQMEYVARLEAKGYARLTAVFIPKSLIPEVRQMIKDRVAIWENNLTNTL